MLDDVLERLLDDPEQRDLHVRSKVAVGHDRGRRENSVLAEAATLVMAAARPRSSSTAGRSPDDRPARLLERIRQETFDGDELDPSGGVGRVRLSGSQVVPGADEPLADAVMDVGGDAAPIELLQLDRACREPLELRLAMTSRS